MDAVHALKKHIVQLACGCDDIKEIGVLETAEQVDDAYFFLSQHHEDLLGEIESGVRPGNMATDIPNEYSRHYESRSVATQIADGRWIGWTYWYGGGKHGEPKTIDWISEAYFLECVETQELVTIRRWGRITAPTKE